MASEGPICSNGEGLTFILFAFHSHTFNSVKALGGKNHVEASTNVKSDAYNMRREGMGSDNQNAAKSLKAMLKSGKGSCKKR